MVLPSANAEVASILTYIAIESAMTLEGMEVGADTLERLLGQGGMGSVWVARRTDGASVLACAPCHAVRLGEQKSKAR